MTCGARIKKGDLQLHLKDCPEKQYECVECNQMFKKVEFRYHISREHGDSMFRKFLKSNNENDQEDEFEEDEETANSRRRTSYLRRLVPPGWQKFYLDPPIQLVGMPNPPELEMTHLNFYDLCLTDQFHYISGMVFYSCKWTSIFLGKFAFNTLISLFKLSFRTIGRGLRNLSSLFFE